MNKADLKKKWSKYCDTDKLVDDMRNLLTKTNHRNSEHGVCVVLDKYFIAKEPLIKMFMTSNHYIGNMRIMMSKEFDRDIDKYAVTDFCEDFPKAIGAKNILLKYEDNNGKTITDYLVTGSGKVNILEYIKKESTKENTQFMKAFDLGTGALKETAKKLDDFEGRVNFFRNHHLSTMTMNLWPEDVDIKKGMKTSRAFNKMCAYYGVDKAKDYNRLFAQYADLVASNTRKLNFVISLNPLDYITMSNGRSWTSCHSTKASSYGTGGMAAGGCVSYMLDEVSIITYVVDNHYTNLHEAGKLYRQMYHYGDNLFVQARLYPQGNDGATDLYSKFRNFMQEEFSELLNVKDEWTNLIGCSYVCRHSDDIGHHYRDARSNNSCGIFYAKEKKADTGHITIGARAYCFYCGELQESRNRLSHTDCTY